MGLRTAGILIPIVASLAVTGSLVTPQVFLSDPPSIPSLEPGTHDELAAFLDEPFVSVLPNGHLLVDLSSGEEARESLAAAGAGGALEGATVELIGGFASPEEIAALDALGERIPIDEVVGKCPGIDAISGPRDAGRTTPYLNCDPGTGLESRGQPVDGNPAESLADALSTAIAHKVPALGGISVGVTLTGDKAEVDIPRSLADAVKDWGGHARNWELGDALVFTVWSNAAVSEVEFTIDGDCLTYAIATGGDICSTTRFGEAGVVMQ